MQQLTRSLSLVIIMLVTTSTSSAIIQVVDTSNLVQAIIRYRTMVQEITNQVEQIGRMDVAIHQAEQQFQAITGPRGISSLLNGIAYQAVRRQLPHNLRGPLDQLAAGHIPTSHQALASGLIALLAYWDIYQDYTQLAPEERQERLSTVKREQLSNNAIGQVMAEQSLEMAGTHNVQIVEQLVETIDSTTDLKASVDLLNRMVAENAFILNQLLQLQAAEAARGSRNDLADSQRKDLNEVYVDIRPHQER